MRMNDFDGKQFLATVRGGDFAHAGEEEAIDLVFEGISPQPDRRILDAGCGRGGTANYVHMRGFGQVVGIDVESQSIEYAQAKYADSKFHVCDICDVGMMFPSSFDLIYLLNAYYAVLDKRKAMINLRKAAVPGGALRIFDYVTYKTDVPLPEVILAEQPATLEEFSNFMKEANWELTSTVNLDEQYAQWYRKFLQRFDEHALKNSYPSEMIERVRSKYSELLSAIESGMLGGVLVIGTAK